MHHIHGQQSVNRLMSGQQLFLVFSGYESENVTRPVAQMCLVLRAYTQCIRCLRFDRRLRTTIYAR